MGTHTYTKGTGFLNKVRNRREKMLKSIDHFHMSESHSFIERASRARARYAGGKGRGVYVRLRSLTYSCRQVNDRAVSS
jgi:hypothetical protein